MLSDEEIKDFERFYSYDDDYQVNADTLKGLKTGIIKKKCEKLMGMIEQIVYDSFVSATTIRLIIMLIGNIQLINKTKCESIMKQPDMMGRL